VLLALPLLIRLSGDAGGIGRVGSMADYYLDFFMYFLTMMIMMYYYDMFRTFSYFYDIYVRSFYIISYVLILPCSC
jgi:hypothetical protein